eukprot:979814-Alexandrium_andersonii.AAC.1
MSASLVGSEMCIRDRPRAGSLPDAGPCLSRCGDRSPALLGNLYAARPAKSGPGPGPRSGSLSPRW